MFYLEKHRLNVVQFVIVEFYVIGVMLVDCVADVSGENNMVLTKSGLKILRKFKKYYGKDGKEIFEKWKSERDGKLLDKKK
jgi:hypothetical protein